MRTYADECGRMQDPKAKANEAIVWYNSKRMQPGGFLDIEEVL